MTARMRLSRQVPFPRQLTSAAAAQGRSTAHAIGGFEGPALELSADGGLCAPTGMGTHSLRTVADHAPDLRARSLG